MAKHSIYMTHNPLDAVIRRTRRHKYDALCSTPAYISRTLPFALGGLDTGLYQSYAFEPVFFVVIRSLLIR